MATSEQYKPRLEALKRDIVAQGRRVQALIEDGFEAIFAGDSEMAKRVIASDEEIDRVDVEIEKSAVGLLTNACGEASCLAAEQLRSVLTIVKVNNELERIADVGVSIAEEVRLFREGAISLPMTFRVLANSVVGIIRDAMSALDRGDPHLAKVVLLSEQAVGEFKKSLARDIQQQVKAGTMSLDLASALHDVAAFCVQMADHCTNIAEQVMYTTSGKIVRHMGGQWEEIQLH